MLNRLFSATGIIHAKVGAPRARRFCMVLSDAEECTKSVIGIVKKSIWIEGNLHRYTQAVTLWIAPHIFVIRLRK